MQNVIVIFPGHTHLLSNHGLRMILMLDWSKNKLVFHKIHVCNLKLVSVTPNSHFAEHDVKINMPGKQIIMSSEYKVTYFEHLSCWEILHTIVVVN